jgi:hypothetical protein
VADQRRRPVERLEHGYRVFDEVRDPVGARRPFRFAVAAKVEPDRSVALQPLVCPHAAADAVQEQHGIAVTHLLHVQPHPPGR